MGKGGLGVGGRGGGGAEIGEDAEARGGEEDTGRGQNLVGCCCLMTSDLSKDVWCYVLPYFF